MKQQGRITERTTDTFFEIYWLYGFLLEKNKNLFVLIIKVGNVNVSSFYFYSFLFVIVALCSWFFAQFYGISTLCFFKIVDSLSFYLNPNKSLSLWMKLDNRSLFYDEYENMVTKQLITNQWFPEWIYDCRFRFIFDYSSHQMFFMTELPAFFLYVCGIL